MPSPTFLGIGVAKAGTTWLAAQMAQHPDVLFGQRKELLYYIREGKYARGRSWYEAQFTDGRADAPAVGEWTPRYFHTAPLERPEGPARPRHRPHWPGAAERVAADYGPDTGHDLRLLVVLRDPVSRAVSDLTHNVRHGFVPFTQSVYEAARFRPAVLECSHYARNFECWFELFPREAFLFLTYEEDIRPDEAKARTLRRVFEHLGVDPEFSPDGVDEPRNVGMSPFQLRRREMHPFLSAAMGLVPRSLRSHPRWDFPVPEGERDRLAETFAADVEYAERLLGRRLPWARPTTSRSGEDA